MSGNITSYDYQFFQYLNTETLALYAGAIAVVLPLVTVLVKLFLRPHVVVNCWFCNTNSRVPSKESNRWYCYHCEQYNGFLPDGDYNKDIPEQREGGARNGVTYATQSKFSSSTNGLCDKCNSNQDMKVKHLAAFQAVVPSNYEEELNIYRNQLETAYRLCQNCESVVSDTLERKKSLVLGMQLKQSEKRILGRQNYTKISPPTFIRKVLTVVAVALCIIAAIPTLDVKKLNLPMLSIMQEKIECNYWAVVAANFSVQLILTICTGRKLPLAVCGAHLGLYFMEDQWGSVDDLSYALSFLSALTLVLTCLPKRRRSAFVKVKKIDRSARNTRFFEREITSETPDLDQSARSSITPRFEDMKSSPAPQREVITIKPVTTDPINDLRTNQDDSSSVDSAFSNHDSCTQDSDSVRGDVNSLIQSLSEWNSKVEERPRTPSSRHEFQSRQYGRDRPLLNPPRLLSTSPKSVNESSWVAGGFWQNHQNAAEQTSRPGSPNLSVYSQASSSWRSSTPGPGATPSPSAFEPMRPSTPTHFPIYVPSSSYGPPNGFQQPYGFQPYLYHPTGVNPLWNPPIFQPISASPASASSVSCSSASTCGSVRRRRRSVVGDEAPVSLATKQHRLSWFEALRQNGSVIFYTSVFYVAVTAIVVFVVRKW